VDGKTGYILTNNHVAGGATEMTITLSDGRTYDKAKLVGADPKTDLAVVKIEADHLIPAHWGDSANLQKGDWVLAFGSPFGYVGSMTHGIVSALDRQAGILGRYGYEDFIQVDAPINPGNSGGPLVNLHGEVVGINTAIASRSGGFQGIGFAIPSDEAKGIYNALKSHGKVTRGWLGVEISDVARERPKAKSVGFPGDKGVFVEGILPGSPAADKLKHYDVIEKVNGKPVESVFQLRNEIASASPNSDVTMTVFRNGHDQDVTIKLAEQPEDLSAIARRPGQHGDQGGPAVSAEALGMRLATPNDELSQKFDLGDQRNGALVTRVSPRSAAAKAGIQPGDLITEVDRKPVKNARQATEALSHADVKKGVLVYVVSPQGSRAVLIGGEDTGE
jgi:serine protease Do